MSNYDSDNNEMRFILKWFVIFIVVMLVIATFTNGFGIFADRYVKPYQEETRKRTYDTSRQMEQGMNRDIARYCEQMRDTTRPLSSRKAVAALIRTNADTYDGVLTPDAENCVSEAKGF
jgi:hypothetical protein